MMCKYLSYILKYRISRNVTVLQNAYQNCFYHILIKSCGKGWICKYEKHQQNYFSCVADCDTTRAEVTIHTIATKYALLLFVQKRSQRYCQTRFTSEKFVSRSPRTTLVLYQPLVRFI